MKRLLIVVTSQRIDEWGGHSLTHLLTHSLTHSLAYSYCSDNNVKIDQSVIDKYSNDSKNDAGGSTTASNNKNSLLANMLLGGDES